jgi:hypothetical protein
LRGAAPVFSPCNFPPQTTTAPARGCCADGRMPASVVAAGGKTGGFSATGGVTTKLRLLEIERAQLGGGPTLFDRDDAFARLQRRG